MLKRRYSTLFTDLAAKNEGAFIPFVVLGDPDYETSKAILKTLIEAGADALEVSIPFTDPVADGPEIQDAILRAFDGGINVERCFTLLKEIRTEYPEIPIGLLMYANLVHASGVERFYERCEEAGVDSVLIADIPLREYAPFHKSAVNYHVDPIFICPPDATDEAIEMIAKYGSGYTYLVSRAGVTGIDDGVQSDLSHNIERLTKAGAPPIVQGFGIATPEQAKYFLASGVKGVISGSAVTKIIRENLDDQSAMLTKLHDFVVKMKVATQGEFL